MILYTALAIALGLALCAMIDRLPAKRLRIATSLVSLASGAGMAFMSHTDAGFAFGMALLGAGIGSLAPERPEPPKWRRPDGPE
ncbi:hypothetical protein [Pseudomonas sp. RIT-PI-AD]|uniref:hypothetical protein n=1 Tax=Pseudomonas sp. RIT-PI-AD TaxID=3035294 RepID=UPI0021D8AB94|nr:hypothetical protein [Pseudomonas sp. RIT-PI-AD]